MNRKAMRWRAVAGIGGIATLLCCGGCASFVCQPTQEITFESTPSKADVYVNGNKMGTTPCAVMVQRKKTCPKVEVKKEGYDDAIVLLSSGYNPWLLGNFMWAYCSTTAFLIDFNADASNQYFPNRYYSNLEPIKATTDTEEPKKKEPEKAKERTKSKLIRFIVANYDQLAADLSRGTGEHLTALFDQLEIPKEKQADAVTKLKDMYVKYAEIPEFARAVEITFPRTEKTEK